MSWRRNCTTPVWLRMTMPQDMTASTLNHQQHNCAVNALPQFKSQLERSATLTARIRLLDHLTTSTTHEAHLAIPAKAVHPCSRLASLHTESTLPYHNKHNKDCLGYLAIISQCSNQASIRPFICCLYLRTHSSNAAASCHLDVTHPSPSPNVP